MKKHAFLSFLLTGCLLFLGCSGKNSGVQTGAEGAQNLPSVGSAETITTFEGDVPAFVQKSGDNWFVIYQNYVGGDYKFAVGDAPDNGVIKDAAEGGIMNLSADGDIAAWGVRSDGKVRIIYYDAKRDESKTIETLLEEEGEYQSVKVHTLGEKVFYQVADYSKSIIRTIAYHVSTGEKETLTEESFARFGGCFSLCEGRLAYQGMDSSGNPELVLLDPDTGETERIKLPSSILALYDADVSGDDIAVYYYDQSEGNNAWNQNDNIGVFTKGDTEFIPFFSFPKTNSGATYYAYKDNIEILGDDVLWIYQQNVSGKVADHYQLTLYNYKTHAPKQEPAAFSFSTDGEALYWLCFVDGSTDKVALHKKDLV